MGLPQCLQTPELGPPPGDGLVDGRGGELRLLLLLRGRGGRWCRGGERGMPGEVPGVVLLGPVQLVPEAAHRAGIVLILLWLLLLLGLGLCWRIMGRHWLLCRRVGRISHRRRLLLWLLLLWLMRVAGIVSLLRGRRRLRRRRGRWGRTAADTVIMMGGVGRGRRAVRRPVPLRRRGDRRRGGGQARGHRTLLLMVVISALRRGRAGIRARHRAPKPQRKR